MNEQRGLPLEGLRVIDMTVVWAGPFATAMLGDMGAEVIRVESLQHTDDSTRGNPLVKRAGENMSGQFPDDDPGERPWERSSNFNTTGRNKKSATMDIARPEGRDAFLRLVAKSDAFIENNAPGFLERHRITYDELSKVNPGLVMVSMPGFGFSGPYRNYRAFGPNMEAIVGHTMLRGYADNAATEASSSFLADAGGGAGAFFATLAGIRHKRHSGKGQFIEISQAENVGHFLSQAMMDYSMNGRIQGPLGNRHPSRAPQGAYRCSGDDAWVAISIEGDRDFQALCRVIGRPELPDLPRFSSQADRRENHEELDGIISSWTERRPHTEVFHALQAAGVAAGPVLTIAEVFADPQLRSREMWQEVDRPYSGSHVYLRPIFRVSDEPLTIRAGAPTLGQDNEYVYKQLLGYSDSEYERMVELHHIGDVYDVVRERQP
jgi:crotonobetainyl-CoA:carnitine CoA-transferase CaiB-like acyl-CoA transferase